LKDAVKSEERSSGEKITVNKTGDTKSGLAIRSLFGKEGVDLISLRCNPDTSCC
jgi:hypothetical protein